MAYVEETKDAGILAELRKETTLLATLSREEDIRKAISTGDWDELRALSLLPGGFAGARVDAWKFLLNAVPRNDGPKSGAAQAGDTGGRSLTGGTLGDLEPHKDERQVGLDTERSFVLYPAEGETPKKSKDDLKAQLHHVIVHVLRKRPKLSYFQGYHDILSVLMLTMNEDQEINNSETDEELSAKLNLMAEKMSLHRLRDSMGPGLEPLVGLLRLVKQLLRAVDPTYAKQLSTTSPLPYFALSNLLTYFSHDVPTLSLVQHIFDYLLSRPPIAIVYLATVMILVRKEEVQTLYEAGDEGMLHALLCNLPDLVDDLPPSLTPPPASNTQQTTHDSTSSNETDPSHALSESWHETTASSPADLSLSQTWTATDSVSSQSWTAAGSVKSESVPSPGTSPTLAPVSAPLIKQESIADSLLDFPPLDPSSRPTSPPIEVNIDEKEGLHQSSSWTLEVSPPQKKQTLSLVNLLKQADHLFYTHPPPTLQTSQIMGPQSVVFTWCETGHVPTTAPSQPISKSQIDLKLEFSEKLALEEKSRNQSAWTTNQADPISDSTAELMVLHPELVVRPWKDEDEMEVEREAELARESRKRAADEKALRKRRAKSHDSGLLRNIGGGKGGVIVIGGVVVVVALGVVIAVYGKNGEWKKWVGRNTWLSRNMP